MPDLDWFCFIDHEDCSHPRCVRARSGDFTCLKGHSLDGQGFCYTCDVVEGVTLEEVFVALHRAGCDPKPRYRH